MAAESSSKPPEVVPEDLELRKRLEELTEQRGKEAVRQERHLKGDVQAARS